jgi:hypothetical protein
MNTKNYCFLLIVLTTTFFSSCDKETDKTDNTTTQITKIETSLKAGETKLEGYSDGQKIETIAPQDYINSIQAALEQSTSKVFATKSTSSSYLVGVFSNGSCGAYRKLTVYMDTEDSDPNSSATGWTGASIIWDDTKRDAYFYFCIVDGSGFQRTSTAAYATLKVDASLPSGVSTFNRYFDNEDKSNGNSWAIDDVAQTKTGSLGTCTFGNNDMLAFNYYTVSTVANTFPDLGISYGVLGTFGDTKGSIYTDDEDSNNANWLNLTLFNDNTNTYNSRVDVASVSDLLKGGENTTLYISKVH